MHPVPHRCQLCNKSNTQKGQLNKHKTISLRQEKLTDGSKNKKKQTASTNLENVNKI